jgi:hypothetical protein
MTIILPYTDNGFKNILEGLIDNISLQTYDFWRYGGSIPQLKY